MKLLQILNEMDFNSHFIGRIKQRILNDNPLDVIIHYRSVRTRQFVDELIGEYKPSPEIYKKVYDGYEYLKNTFAKSSSKYNFIVKMHTFDLLNEWKNFNFDPNLDEQELNDIYDDVKNRFFDLRVREKNTGSAGQTLITVIKNNFIVSTMFSYEKTDDDIEKRHGKGDICIVLDSPYQIDKYLNLDAKMQ